MKEYRGYRRRARNSVDGEPTATECFVLVFRDAEATKGRPLGLRLDIRNHSPTGFEWGYGGSGPAQLALAMVADCCGDEAAQPRLYQRVKRDLVARLPEDGWVLTEEDIRACVAAAQAEIAE